MIFEFNKDSKKDVHKILKQHNNVTILYYSDMCGHCLKLMPVWKRLFKKYDKSKEIAIINVEANNINLLQVKYKKIIEGFPTILKYKNGKLIEEYNGDRKTKSLNIFILK